MKTTNRRLRLGLLVVIAIALGLLAWPREDLWLRPLGFDQPWRIKRGLDLAGGVYLVYQAKLEQVEDQAVSDQELVKNAAAVIERRINPGGASEAVVQTAGDGRIIVQIPSIDNPDQAIANIGRTAQLEFFEVTLGESGQSFLPTDINGQDVARARVDFVPPSSQPIVSLEFKGGEATEQFAALTTRLAGSDSQLLTLLDDQVVFGPAGVQNPITDGRAQLSGGFDTATAQSIATLLNAGALPVPVELVAQSTIGPALGEQALRASLLAAAVGLLAIIGFLLAYYRRAGLVAVGSLTFYSLALLSVIKLSAFTDYAIVLTLAGIAGFILSMAVVVDANILILERAKEEMNKGNSPRAAAYAGLEHAWPSIRDANITTLIATIILYWLGAPLIKGFALTLGVGVVLNLLSVRTVSQLLLTSLVRTKWVNRPGWLGRSRT